jgi:hypothetical protein
MLPGLVGERPCHRRCRPRDTLVPPRRPTTHAQLRTHTVPARQCGQQYPADVITGVHTCPTRARRGASVQLTCAAAGFSLHIDCGWPRSVPRARRRAHLRSHTWSGQWSGESKGRAHSHCERNERGRSDGCGPMLRVRSRLARRAPLTSARVAPDGGAEREGQHGRASEACCCSRGRRFTIPRISPA